MTDIEIYDRAVYSYLYTISDKIVYATTENAKRSIAKNPEYADSKPWSFISYCRDNQFNIDWSLMNKPAALIGDFTKMRSIDGNRVATYVHNIPVTLVYYVDIWASTNPRVQELAIDLISKLYMKEQVLVAPMNPDGEGGRFNFSNITWRDNSDIEREVDIGRIYRHTISFEIDSRIKLVREMDTTEITCIPVNIYE